LLLQLALKNSASGLQLENSKSSIRCLLVRGSWQINKQTTNLHCW